MPMPPTSLAMARHPDHVRMRVVMMAPVMLTNINSDGRIGGLGCGPGQGAGKEESEDDVLHGVGQRSTMHGSASKRCPINQRRVNTRSRDGDDGGGGDDSDGAR